MYRVNVYIFFLYNILMDKIFSDKINILKALAIVLVVSGHLEFRFFDMFPPYSFQLALFFFISGMLFKEKYLDNAADFIKRRVKSLLLLYFLYSAFYAVVTVILAKLTGKFWGMDLNLYNFFVTPFLNGHQFDLSCPMWFVTQLFITMVTFLFLERMFRNLSTTKKSIIYTLMGFSAIPLSKVFPLTPVFLVIIRTMFSLFFVYLGHFYIKKIHGNYNIFTPKILGIVLCIQAVLWHFNRDFDPTHGIGLSYVLVWARFDSQIIVPVLTSITGIWFSLFFIELTYNYLKDIKFVRLIGENTYHIMANHLFVMYIITAVIFKLNGIPISERNTHNIYWIFNPVQNTYLYFILTMIITTYTGVFLKRIKKRLPVIKDF